MKINIKNLYNFIGIFLLCIIFFFETQISLYGLQIITIIQVIILFFLFLALLSKSKIIYAKNIYPFLLTWILMLPFFLYGMLHSEKNVVFRILFGIIMCCFLIQQTEWLKYLKKFLLFFSGSAIFFTFFFWFMPNLYSAVVDFYGYYPPGTGQLKYGYRAGITAHYSQNGIFIAVFIMTLITWMLSEKSIKKSKYKNAFRIIVVILAFLAFLLNGKRGTLVWCVVALIITWFVSTPNKSKFITRVIILGCLCIVVLQVAVDNIPSLNFVVERFSELGSDNSSSDRLAMWGLALNSFTRSPILGIGFMNFRELYNINLASTYVKDFTDISSYSRLDAHNVYIQILCETGIVGFVIYIIGLVLLIKYTLKTLKYFSYRDEYHYKYAAMLSFCFQIFYLLYSLSGNCLYDMTFYLYIIAMAITGSLTYKMNHDERLIWKR